MDINKEDLKAYVYEKMKNSKSRPIQAFSKETYMKDKIEKALDSEFFLNLLVFNNDHFEIAGQYTFAGLFVEEDKELNKFQKSILGAFIRFIFEYFGYIEIKRSWLNRLNLQWGKLYRKAE